MGPKRQKLENSSSNSIVLIESSDCVPDYVTPWMTSHRSQNIFGSGSVIDKEKGWVLTCAHLSNQSTQTTVRLGAARKKYTAKVLVSDDDYDLSLLQIDDPEFRKNATAVNFGEFAIQPINSAISVAGYSSDYKQITTRATVLRHEIHPYLLGDIQNLSTLITGYISPGSGGGPIFDAEGLYQTGVLFQQMNPSEAEPICYVIPAPVIKHFLKMAIRAIETGRPAQGIPDLPIEIQTMENPTFRQAYGMVPQKHSGIRVQQIDTLAEMGGLQVDDIILSINNHRVENDGSIRNMPHIAGFVPYHYLATQQQMGGNLQMTVLRNKQELSLNVSLKYRANDLKLIARQGTNEEPTFYIKNGICFQLVSQNYLYTENGSVFLGLESVSKNSADEQLIVVHKVFNSNHTLYDHEHEMGNDRSIDNINGIKITNIRDVIFAMESKKSGKHEIVLKNKNEIVMNVATPEQEEEIKHMYDISKTHSDNLLPIIQAARAAQTGASSLLSNQYLQLQLNKNPVGSALNLMSSQPLKRGIGSLQQE